MATPPTQRELDALKAVRKPGGSMASAAYELGVSSHANHKRLRSAYRRLDVNSVGQAVYMLYGPDATAAPDPR